ncbi:hypothetical protein [Pelagibacterium luteolum]|uniref:Uncharacterized protein n=1 Tax=Pelagibacterium luteolum TaxID=440168 RepID=A0A1G7Z9F2_9HYPH|nr:hypothetical protein [Pelagibacterium luteolum]SDH05227.1 hypothetical protein SAMN04487974_11841 [Pelagibacterium luteolum]
MDNGLYSRPQSGQSVCGQAHAVLDNLSRTQDLPNTLSLSIEEILERAWEIAYRRQAERREGNVIALSISRPDGQDVR